MDRQFSLASFAGGLVVGIILAVAWFVGGPPLNAPAVDTTQAAATNTPPTGTPSGAIAVSNQPAGNSVLVDSVTVPPPGVWVAVREVNGSQLGNVLGAARVGAPRTNVTVPLLRATMPGQTYAVELYRDSGNDKFDLNSDSVYVDFDTGHRVVAYFNTKP